MDGWNEATESSWQRETEIEASCEQNEENQPEEEIQAYAPLYLHIRSLCFRPLADRVWRKRNISDNDFHDQHDSVRRNSRGKLRKGYFGYHTECNDQEQLAIRKN